MAGAGIVGADDLVLKCFVQHRGGFALDAVAVTEAVIDEKAVLGRNDDRAGIVEIGVGQLFGVAFVDIKSGVGQQGDSVFGGIHRIHGVPGKVQREARAAAETVYGIGDKAADVIVGGVAHTYKQRKYQRDDQDEDDKALDERLSGTLFAQLVYLVYPCGHYKTSFGG